MVIGWSSSKSPMSLYGFGQPLTHYKYYLRFNDSDQGCFSHGNESLTEITIQKLNDTFYRST